MVLAGRIERYILCGKRALASSFVFMYFCKYLSLLIANATQFRLFPQLNRELSPAQVIASTSKSRLKPRASDSAKIAAKARKEKENEEKSELKSPLTSGAATSSRCLRRSLESKFVFWSLSFCEYESNQGSSTHSKTSETRSPKHSWDVFLRAGQYENDVPACSDCRPVSTGFCSVR